MNLISCQGSGTGGDKKHDGCFCSQPMLLFDTFELPGDFSPVPAPFLPAGCRDLFLVSVGLIACFFR